MRQRTDFEPRQSSVMLQHGVLGNGWWIMMSIRFSTFQLQVEARYATFEVCASRTLLLISISRVQSRRNTTNYEFGFEFVMLLVPVVSSRVSGCKRSSPENTQVQFVNTITSQDQTNRSDRYQYTGHLSHLISIAAGRIEHKLKDRIHGLRRNEEIKLQGYTSRPSIEHVLSYFRSQPVVLDNHLLFVKLVNQLVNLFN